MSVMIARVAARSKVDQVADRIRALIYQGKLVAGQRLACERELATQFSVSTPTLNKAMAALEIDGLLDRKTGRGTFVREGLAAGGTVAVVFHQRHMVHDAPFYGAMMNALLVEVGRHKMRPQFVVGCGETGKEFTESLHPTSPLWRHIVGVISMAWLPDEGFEDALAENGKPVVTLSSYRQGRHCVRFDFPALIRMSCEHLAAGGYREIGLITNEEAAPGMDRSEILSSFEAITSELGLTTKPHWRKTSVVGAMNGREAMHELWKGADRPRAIVVSDENIAVGVGEALLEMGIRCPDDLAVISHGTIGVNLDMPLEFTRCCFELQRVCEMAWDLLNHLTVGGMEVPALQNVIPHIVSGKTT